MKSTLFLLSVIVLAANATASAQVSPTTEKTYRVSHSMAASFVVQSALFGVTPNAVISATPAELELWSVGTMQESYLFAAIPYVEVADEDEVGLLRTDATSFAVTIALARLDSKSDASVKRYAKLTTDHVLRFTCIAGDPDFRPDGSNDRCFVLEDMPAPARKRIAEAEACAAAIMSDHAKAIAELDWKIIDALPQWSGNPHPFSRPGNEARFVQFKTLLASFLSEHRFSLPDPKRHPEAPVWCIEPGTDNRPLQS